MVKKFRRLAEELEDIYGNYYDREEVYFVCPHCDEPIYACDWAGDKNILSECPVCGEDWFDTDDDF